MTPFIKPFQLNEVRNILQQLLNAVYFAGDYRVYEATKQSTVLKLEAAFNGLTEDQRRLFQGVENFSGQDEVSLFLESLEPYLIPFPHVTANQIKRLFPKVKKLVLPELDDVDFRKLVYLGWRDVATHSLYIVYEAEGTVSGIQCRYTVGPANRTSVCSVCKQSRSAQHVALVAASSHVDGNRSYGVHMCLDSDVCNRHIRNKDGLTDFVERLKRK